MTRILYRVVSLLMFITGVVTFDHWGNTVNIPTDKSEEIRETRLFPARHIRARPPSNCTCDSVLELDRYPSTYYPNIFATTKCADRSCVDSNQCKEVQYSFTVFSLKDTKKDGTRYTYDEQSKCRDMWKAEERFVPIACVPGPSQRRDSRCNIQNRNYKTVREYSI